VDPNYPDPCRIFFIAEQKNRPAEINPRKFQSLVDGIGNYNKPDFRPEDPDPGDSKKIRLYSPPINSGYPGVPFRGEVLSEAISGEAELRIHGCQKRTVRGSGGPDPEMFPAHPGLRHACIHFV
jgi:hypothetical protein